MYELKEKRGITLISLVVTIVILLILAGVSISTLAGDNGVINRAQRATEMSEVAAFKDTATVAYMNALSDDNKGVKGIQTVTVDDLIEELSKSYQIITIETGSVELASSNADTNIELFAGETVSKRVITSKDSTTNYVELKGKYYRFYLKNGKIEVDEGVKERPNATNDYSFTATSSNDSLASVEVTPDGEAAFIVEITGEGETTSGSPAIITVSYGGSLVHINVNVKACNLIIMSEDTNKGTVEITANPAEIGTNKYKKGTSVTIEATANTGYIFSGWYRVTGEGGSTSESLISSENPYTFTIENENDTIKAKFNEATLIQGFVDDLGTRAMIYLYANPYANEEGDQITIKDSSNNYLVDVDGTTRSTAIKAVANNTNADGKFEITGTDYSNAKQYYIAYPVTQNGEYTFNAIKGGVSSTITVSVENIETFTAIETLATTENLSYAGGDTKAYTYKGTAVPKGYYVDTNSDVDTGLVITDGIDEYGYSTGNEWVWVPVNSTVGNNSFYEADETGTMAGVDNNTKALKYGNFSLLYNFTTDIDTKTTTRTARPKIKPSLNSSNREIAILTDSSNGEKANLSSIYSRATAKNTSPTAIASEKAVAEQYIEDYNSMVTSVVTYGGFYIGRYEITANGEKPGTSLTNSTWFSLYNKCMTLNKDYTETSMMYGTLWDATMQWLDKSGYVVGKGNTSSGYGNYKTEAVKVSNSTTTIIVKPSGKYSKLSTGQTSYTKSNNIYDLSGNYSDWTQEAYSTTSRVLRGGCSDDSGVYSTYSASRKDHMTTNGTGNYSSRPQLYIK